MTEDNRVTVSLSRKTQLAPYEMAEVFISLSLNEGASQDEIDAALATGALAYKSIAAAINKKIGEIKS